MKTGPTDLYRFYDLHHRLLYVGISLSFAKRMGQHRGDKPWWPDVAEAAVERFESRVEAAHAEEQAIRTELPLRNIRHNVHPAPRRCLSPDLYVGDVVGLGFAGTPTAPFGKVIDITNQTGCETIWLQQMNHDDGTFTSGVIDFRASFIGGVYYVSDHGNSIDGALEFCQAWRKRGLAAKEARRLSERKATKARLTLMSA